MRYFVVGYCHSIGLKSGIYDYRIEEFASLEDAEKLGAKLAREVIQICCNPSEDWYTHDNYVEDNGLEKWDNCYEEEYKGVLETVICGEIAYQIWRVKDETTSEAIRLWANSDDDAEEFIERYCDHQLIDF